LTRLSGRLAGSDRLLREDDDPGGTSSLLLSGLVPFVSWKGETPGVLLRNAVRSLAVAAVLTLAAVVSERGGSTPWS